MSRVPAPHILFPEALQLPFNSLSAGLGRQAAAFSRVFQICSEFGDSNFPVLGYGAPPGHHSLFTVLHLLSVWPLLAQCWRKGHWFLC